MPRLASITTAVAILAAGCTLQPRYERPAAPVAPAFPAGGAYGQQPAASGAESATAATRAADIGWRDFFADPRLQRLLELALKNNRDLRVSVLNIEAARAQYQITRAALFPSVNAVASGTRARTPANLTASGRTIAAEYSVGLNASWEIDFFGRIRSLSDQALAQYLSLAESRKAAELALLSSVANQYLAMLAFDDALAVTRATLVTAEESLRITSLKFDVGTGSELDLRQSEGVVEQARANLETETRLRAQAENGLVLLVGEPLPEDLPPGLPLNSQALLADIPAGLPSDLLTRRPDIAAAEQLLLAANANIGAARAAFFPRVTLTGNAGTLSPTLGGLFKPGSGAWSFAPQITLPIFQGGQNVAALDLAQVQKRIEIASYEKAIQTAFREVSDGLAARGTFDNQIKSLERFTGSQERRLVLSDLRYRNGVDSYLSVLTAQNDLYSAQLLLINARLQRLTNLVDLYQFLGGGWIERAGDTPRPADAPADYSMTAPAPAPGTASP
ncbi:efflux transporter outer membrane subunit [Cupriavidus basilensis]|uniref:efflux transporter outer membrane subunit n=1 Tax=Cupriavidus basilensis TaxID=68895 RepID=UPI0023E89AF8|nr:efflux transporter outer membrane subunit [Cupriavidus basilensis]MDF3884201.1 efflux transporter outer membrane subunit [Cupriavidus basilensis]